ncbi:MAG: DUF3576 domain-containing protein [Alphaproteobacteria bacterium]|nr:DUF3576 domain-containing protein [Alphaproteobacteria bacterium]
MRTLFALAFILALTSCSGVGRAPVEEKSAGSILTGKDTQGINLLELGETSNSETGLPINALLWRASLDIASSIPLDDIDTFGGTIVTEWYQLDENNEERIKLAIFVLDRELRSDGIRVVVYVQKRDGSDWRDEGTDSEMGLRLEELILTRAREIRAGTVSETN